MGALIWFVAFCITETFASSLGVIDDENIQLGIQALREKRDTHGFGSESCLEEITEILMMICTNGIAGVRNRRSVTGGNTENIVHVGGKPGIYYKCCRNQCSFNDFLEYCA